MQFAVLGQAEEEEMSKVERFPAIRWSLRRPASSGDIDYMKSEAERCGYKRPFLIEREYRHGQYTLYLYELRNPQAVTDK